MRRLRWLWIVPALAGVWQVGLLLSAVFRRWSYPYDLEWMEGGMLSHALRLSRGTSIYPPPSIHFIPYLYTPLYPAVLAALGKIFGLGYKLGRAVSILSIACVIGVGAWTIVRDTSRERRFAAACGAAIFAGYFAATYPWVEGWYDLVRCDSFFLAMGVVGLALLGSWAHRGHGRVAACAAILGLSFFAKQTGVLLVAGGGVAILVMNWRMAPTYALTAGAIGGGGSLLLNKLTHGWFWIYIYKVHQQHDTNKARFFRSFKNILWHFPAMTCVIAGALIVVATLAATGRPLSERARRFLYWSWIFACGIVIGAAGWATQWALYNAYMPAMTFGAIACGHAIALLAEESEPAAGAVATVAAVGLLVARWHPGAFVPRPADRLAGDRLIRDIRKIPGDVYVPSHPWYAMLAGKSEPYTHRMSIKDVTYEAPASAHKKKLPPRAQEVEDLQKDLAGKRFGAIVMDDRFDTSEFPGLTDGYRQAQTLPGNESPHVIDGAPTLPHTIWVPKETSPLPKGTKVLWDFEAGFKDWTADGTAWAGVSELPNRLAGGVRGAKLVASTHGAEKATGTLTSASFELTGKPVTIRLLASRPDDPDLRAELHVSVGLVGWIEAVASAPTGDMLAPVSFDVTGLAGARAQLVLVDHSTAGWLAADEVEEGP